MDSFCKDIHCASWHSYSTFSALRLKEGIYRCCYSSPLFTHKSGKLHIRTKKETKACMYISKNGRLRKTSLDKCFYNKYLKDRPLVLISAYKKWQNNLGKDENNIQ